MWLHAPPVSETSEDSVKLAEPTAPAAQDQLPHAPHVSMVMLWTRLAEPAKSLPHASSVNTTPNPPAHALESALKAPSSMKMSASPPASQASTTTESEDASLSLLKVDAHSPTTSATESASATVPQALTPIQTSVSARAAHPTASAASPTPSATPAMLASTSKTESASPQASTALPANTDTTVSATATAQLEPALKVTSVKELAPLELGHSTTAATEPAPPSTLLLMPASTLAPPAPHSSMVSAKLDLKLAPQANTGTDLDHHVRTVNILAHNALLLPPTVLPAQLA